MAARMNRSERRPPFLSGKNPPGPFAGVEPDIDFVVDTPDGAITGLSLEQSPWSPGWTEPGQGTFGEPRVYGARSGQGKKISTK